MLWLVIARVCLYFYSLHVFLFILVLFLLFAITRIKISNINKHPLILTVCWVILSLIFVCMFIVHSSQFMQCVCVRACVIFSWSSLTEHDEMNRCIFRHHLSFYTSASCYCCWCWCCIYSAKVQFTNIFTIWFLCGGNMVFRSIHAIRIFIYSVHLTQRDFMIMFGIWLSFSRLWTHQKSFRMQNDFKF